MLTLAGVRRCAIIAFAIASALASMADQRAPAQVPQAPLFGFNEGYQRYEGASLRSAVGDSRVAGAEVARFPLAWAGVEPERGRYDWRAYDALYRELLAHGVRPLPVIVDSPWWARPRRPRRPEDFAAQHPGRSSYPEWERFAAAVAERYAESVAIEVWNEPNSGHFWGGPPDPKRYVELLEVAHAAVNRVDPTMPVLLAGPAPRIDRRAQWDGFLRRVYAHGAAEVSDGLSLHPYATQAGPQVPQVVEQVRGAKALVGELHPGAPIWVTELGFSTRPGARNRVSELRQAALLADVYLRLREEGATAILFHRLREVRTGNPTEDGYGITRVGGERKPAFCALVLLHSADRFC